MTLDHLPWASVSLCKDGCAYSYPDCPSQELRRLKSRKYMLGATSGWVLVLKGPDGLQSPAARMRMSHGPGRLGNLAKCSHCYLRPAGRSAAWLQRAMCWPKGLHSPGLKKKRNKHQASNFPSKTWILYSSQVAYFSNVNLTIFNYTHQWKDASYIES